MDGGSIPPSSTIDVLHRLATGFSYCAFMRKLTTTESQFWLEWLNSRNFWSDGLTGYRISGWEASTWVLHSAFKTPDQSSDLVDPETTMDFIVPDSNWERIRWKDFDRYFDVSISSEFPPGFSRFSQMLWPENFVLPCEGTLDAISLHALQNSIALNTSKGMRAECIAYYSAMASDLEFEEGWLCELTLDELPEIVNPKEVRSGTPNNFWPIDKSWMVYTDHDLWGTLISGSQDLITTLKSNSMLECLDWSWPTKSV